MILLKRKQYRISSCMLTLLVFTGCLKLADLQAQVFRGYYSDGSIEFKSKINKHRQIIRGYYPSGAVEFIASYKHGKLHGITREYYENGVLKAEIPYKDDLIHGIAKFYYENGMLMGKISYWRGKETGKAKYYNRDGILTSSTPRIRLHDRHQKKNTVEVDSMRIINDSMKTKQ